MLVVCVAAAALLRLLHHAWYADECRGSPLRADEHQQASAATYRPWLATHATSEKGGGSAAPPRAACRCRRRTAGSPSLFRADRAPRARNSTKTDRVLSSRCTERPWESHTSLVGRKPFRRRLDCFHAFSKDDPPRCQPVTRRRSRRLPVSCQSTRNRSRRYFCCTSGDTCFVE